MHAISSYRGNRPTNTHTHKHTHKPTDRTDYNTLCCSLVCSVKRAVGMQSRCMQHQWIKLHRRWCPAYNTFNARLIITPGLGSRSLPVMIGHVNTSWAWKVSIFRRVNISLALNMLMDSVTANRTFVWKIPNLRRWGIYAFRCQLNTLT